jgi:hypothetical protein
MGCHRHRLDVRRPRHPLRSRQLEQAQGRPVNPLVMAVIDPPTWVMPTVALVGPILIVAISLLFQRGRN